MVRSCFKVNVSTINRITKGTTLLHQTITVKLYQLLMNPFTESQNVDPIFCQLILFNFYGVYVFLVSFKFSSIFCQEDLLYVYTSRLSRYVISTQGEKKSGFYVQSSVFTFIIKYQHINRKNIITNYHEYAKQLNACYKYYFVYSNQYTSIIGSSYGRLFERKNKLGILITCRKIK